ncbi:MAG: uL15 family ribosomal protein [Nanoarchaeota archaeon]|nr:uL15 family ribosomal protein [Nanoarchaeota archaeon]
MKSKSKIEKQIVKKTNPVLVETIILAKKNPKWLEIAHILTGSRKKRKNFNLTEIEKTEGELIAIPGKVLSNGEISKKKKVIALNFSSKAREKLKKAGCDVVLLADEIKKNKEAKGVVILNAKFKDSTLSKTKEVFNK